MAIKREVPQRNFMVNPVSPGNGFAFTASDLNTILRNGFMDDMDFWQRNYGVFSFMKLTNMRKFILHTIKGSPLVWQVYKACYSDVTGSSAMDRIELEPQAVTMHQQLCYKEELLGSCFKHWVEFQESGEDTLSPEAQQLFNELVDEILAQMVVGTQASLTSGNWYNVNNVTFSNGTTQKEIDDFKKTHGSVDGWIKFVFNMAAQQFGHWNQNTLVTPGDFNDGVFQGSVVDVYDALRSGAKSPLKRLVDRGELTSSGMTMFPLFVVSDSFYQAVVKDYNNLANQVATNRTRLAQRLVNGRNVYYIDNTPIVPLEAINAFDQFTNNQINYAGIVASGNIHLGLSFSGIPTDAENPSQMGVQVATVNDFTRADNGTTHWLSNALMKTYVSDADYMSGLIVETTY